MIYSSKHYYVNAWTLTLQSPRSFYTQTKVQILQGNSTSMSKIVQHQNNLQELRRAMKIARRGNPSLSKTSKEGKVGNPCKTSLLATLGINTVSHLRRKTLRNFHRNSKLPLTLPQDIRLIRCCVDFSQVPTSLLTRKMTDNYTVKSSAFTSLHRV